MRKDLGIDMLMNLFNLGVINANAIKNSKVYEDMVEIKALRSGEVMSAEELNACSMMLNLMAVKVIGLKEIINFFGIENDEISDSTRNEIRNG